MKCENCVPNGENCSPFELPSMIQPNSFGTRKFFKAMIVSAVVSAICYWNVLTEVKIKDAIILLISIMVLLKYYSIKRER